MGNFGQLPSEIILLITRQLCTHELYHYTLINKYLYTTTNSLLWHAPYLYGAKSFNAFNSTLCDATTSHLGQHIRSLTIDESQRLTDEILLQWMKNLENLETFELDPFFPVTQSCFQQFVAHCPRLITLKIDGLSCLTSRSLSVLNQHCYQQLQHVTLGGSFAFSCTVFSALADCTLLKTLDITFDPDYDDTFGYDIDMLQLEDWEDYLREDLVGISDSVVTKAMLDMTGFKHLETLRLCFPRQQRFCNLLFAPNLKDRDGNIPWPQLTTLKIEHPDSTYHNNNIHVSNLIRTHPKLQTLCFENIRLTDDFLDTLSTCLMDLRHLEIHECDEITKDGVRRLAQQCHSIEFIRVPSSDIMANDFPEASLECLNINYKSRPDRLCELLFGNDASDEPFPGMYDGSTVHHLDHDAIKKIRQNAGI